MKRGSATWRRSTSAVAVIAVVLTALVISACGDDSGSGASTPASSGSGSSTTPDASAGSSNKQYPFTGAAKYMYGDKFADYVGADGMKRTKADASKTPIYLGWMNTDVGVTSRPYNTKIADASVWMVNNVLGGVDGHPLKLKKCSLESNEADGQKCAQQFVNDKSVKMIIEGADITGGTSFHNTFRGAKPVVAGVATGPYDIGAKNTVGLSGSRLVGGALMDYFVKTGKKNIVYLSANSPLLVAAFNQTKDQAKALGLDVKLTPIYFDATATDVTPTIIAANLKQYDAIYFVSPSAALCIPAMKALESQGISDSIPIVPTTACYDPTVKKAVGDLPKWNYFFFGPLIYAPFKPEDEIASYIQAARETKNTAAIDAEPASGTIVTGQILHAVKLMNKVGVDNLTNEKLSEELPKLTGHVFMGAPELKYGAFAGLPNIGAVGFYMYDYQGDGKYVPVNNGQWISLPTA